MYRVVRRGEGSKCVEWSVLSTLHDGTVSQSHAHRRSCHRGLTTITTPANKNDGTFGKYFLYSQKSFISFLYIVVTVFLTLDNPLEQLDSSPVEMGTIDCCNTNIYVTGLTGWLTQYTVKLQGTHLLRSNNWQ